MANKPIVIAFSGGCFSGKTTTMEKLKETLEARGHRVTMLSELVREHKIESIDKLRENPSKYLAFQNEIISAKIEAENACKSTDTDVILIDRAITDSMFYLLFYVDKNKLSFEDITLFYGLFGRIKTHMLRAWHEIYDLIIEFAVPASMLARCSVLKCSGSVLISSMIIAISSRPSNCFLGCRQLSQAPQFPPVYSSPK